MDDLISTYKALAGAQKNMTGARKSAKNPHFKKAYADLGDVQDACMDALHSNGFAVFQPTGQDELGMFVKTILAHESGGILECRTPLLVGKNDMQGLGSAITYARRYGLLCMSGVAPEDDDGNSTVQQTRQDLKAARETALTEDCQTLEAAKSLQDLQAHFEAIFRRWGEGQVPAEVIKTKDAMKARLTEEQREAA